MTDIVSGQASYQNQRQTMYAQGLFKESATQKLTLGTVRVIDDGRAFVYCQATNAALVAGHCVSKNIVDQLCTVAALDAVDAGAQKITLTITGAPTLNQYRDGWLIITAGIGIGGCYKIRGNTADDNPASGRCTFYLYDPLEVALTTAGQTISIYENPYDGVLINPAVANAAATTQEQVLGVTQRAVTALYYFWAQIRGFGGIQMDAGAMGDEANEMAIIQGSTAGRGLLLADTFTPGMQILGYTSEQVDATDNETTLANFCIG